MLGGRSNGWLLVSCGVCGVQKKYGVIKGGDFGAYGYRCDVV